MSFEPAPAAPAADRDSQAPIWQPDVLGPDFQQVTIPLGTDPDGEGDIVATLVRYNPSAPPEVPGTDAVLYVHGFTDYFFQRHLAEHFTAQRYRFYALDLRKCGRSRRPGQTAHYVTDLAHYDAELDSAVDLVRQETDGARIVVVAHSTGGLVVPLWLHRRNQRGAVTTAGIRGLVLNSPWFDLQGPKIYRNIGTVLIRTIGRWWATVRVPQGLSSAYGESLHHSAAGEWDFDLDWKPLPGFPVRFGWLRAVRRAQARLHRGLQVGVPTLLLRSSATTVSRHYRPAVDTADAVLDVRQIQRWSGCLGDRTSIVPIDGARHDVFLSAEKPRNQAFAELDSWLRWLADYRP